MITSPAIEYWRNAMREEQTRRHQLRLFDESIEALKSQLMLYQFQENEIEQMIASLYPDEFPRYPDAWHTDDLCVGEHVTMSLLDKLINEVIELRRERDERTTNS